MLNVCQALLRHDKPLHSAPQAEHLRHVPAYLRAAAGMTGPSRSAVGGKRQGSSDKGQVPLTKRQRTKRAGTDPLAAIGKSSAVVIPGIRALLAAGYQMGVQHIWECVLAAYLQPA